MIKNGEPLEVEIPVKLISKVLRWTKLSEKAAKVYRGLYKTSLTIIPQDVMHISYVLYHYFFISYIIYIP